MLVLLMMVLVGGVSPLTPPAPPSNLLLDTSLCPPTDSLTLCQLRKVECSGLDQLLAPPGGVVDAVATCTAAANLTLPARFFKALGVVYLKGVKGSPDSLADLVSPDPTASTAIRRCVLNATGLLDPDTLTLNRSVVATAVNEAVSSQALRDAVAASVETCPEPVDFHTEGFVSCVRAGCIMNADKSPLVSQALSLLPPPATISKSPLKAPLVPPFFMP